MKSSNETMTREEAIAVIRKNYPHVGFSGTEFETALRELIPELAESEDEKIRKWLYDYISNCPNNNFAFYGGVGKDAVLNYLEKQKEPEYESYKVEREMWVEATVTNSFPEQDGDFISEEDYRKILRMTADNFYEMGRKQKEQKLLPGFDDLTPDEKMNHPLYLEGFDTGREVGRVEAEQKPTSKVNGEPIPTKNRSVNIPLVEWSEEDKEALDMCIDAIPKAWKTKSGILLTKWLKDNIHLQSKQEWSEEDEKCLQELMQHIEHCCTIYGASQPGWWRWLNLLKSLRPQPYKEVYQAAKHDLAIKFMNYLDENRPEGKMSLSNGECEDIDKAFKENDWAKIMRYVEKYRPSWKPTNEQMTALNALNCNGCLSYVGQQNDLISLYNDLKKLM